MKVKDLIKLLQKENPESNIVLRKHSEGNGYSLLVGIDGHAIYLKEGEDK